MTSGSDTVSGREMRLLLCAVTVRDAALMTELLGRLSLQAQRCTVAALPPLLHAGAGALVLAEDGLAEPGMSQFLAWLGGQPPWSDLPVVLLARPGATSPALLQLLERLPTAIVLERPMQASTFLGAIRAALANRRRQYELRRRLTELQEADQRKTAFLAILAHELRNPLAPLRTGLDLLQRMPSPEPQVQRVHAMMSRQVTHMVRLVDDLLDVARISQDKIQLRMQPLALEQVLQEAIDLSRPQLEARRHGVQLEVADACTVYGDQVRMVQVFSNLLNNAARYSPEGAGVQISQSVQVGQACVAVSDRGVGLAPDALASIFDMFVQVPGPDRVAQGGLGIGLTLVRDLVMLHGGTVQAASDGLGRGACFTVRLPLAERPA